jgi:hypothetical protein
LEAVLASTGIPSGDVSANSIGTTRGKLRAFVNINTCFSVSTVTFLTAAFVESVVGLFSRYKIDADSVLIAGVGFS